MVGNTPKSYNPIMQTSCTHFPSANFISNVHSVSLLLSLQKKKKFSKLVFVRTLCLQPYTVFKQHVKFFVNFLLVFALALEKPTKE